jgi:predicted O-methyltransferase YrrM
MASIASVDRLNGMFLHLCARAVGAETICEVGTAAGISGSYLALAPSCRRLYGLEGSAARLDLARATFAACGIEAKVCLILGAFEETLPRLVAQDVRINLAYIDGDHRRQPTLDVFETLLGQLRPGAMVIFDDIRWSAEMFETWLELREWRGFSDTVDLGRMGLGIWTGTDGRPRVWDLARGLAWPKPVRVVERAHLGES